MHMSYCVIQYRHDSNLDKFNCKLTTISQSELIFFYKRLAVGISQLGILSKADEAFHTEYQLITLNNTFQLRQRLQNDVDRNKVNIMFKINKYNLMIALASIKIRINMNRSQKVVEKIKLRPLKANRLEIILSHNQLVGDLHLHCQCLLDHWDEL